MLGAVADLLPLSAEDLRSRVVEVFRARKPALADLNGRAFDAGRAAVSRAPAPEPATATAN